MMKAKKISKNKFIRMMGWAWLQKLRTQKCPETPSLEGKIVVVTGGNRGIGLETVMGLLDRGAEVIVLARNEGKIKEIRDRLRVKLHYARLDLSDLNSTSVCVEKVKNILQGRKIDVLINNAGIALSEPHSISPQGYEMTFAVNVLGHHALFKMCHNESLFSFGSQIIAVTGDLYIQAKDCTSDFHYDGKNGMQAYARSKLGVMWWAYECYRLFTEYKVNIVHPGVVPLGLNSSFGSITGSILNMLFLSPEGGAQTTLICATQPYIENGAYYINNKGKAILAPNDIARDKTRAHKLWCDLEAIYDSKITH